MVNGLVSQESGSLDHIGECIRETLGIAHLYFWKGLFRLESLDSCLNMLWW